MSGHIGLPAGLAPVVARGRGMPILVSSVWIIVGTGAGIPVRGVGLPGHFIARVGEGIVTTIGSDASN